MSHLRIRIKNLVTINDDVLDEKTDPDLVFEYVDVGSVGTGVLAVQPGKVSFADAPTRARRVVRPGDTIISTVRTYLKAVLPITEDLKDVVVSTGFAVMRPKPDVDSRYLSWTLQSDRFVNDVVSRSTGVSYPAINPFALADIHIAVVRDPARQRLISDFLDRETERIDALIDAKRRLIDLIAEKRTALITHAVTKGLDSSVPMKSSGIPWIGEIPAHWEVAALRRFSVQIQTGPFGSQLHSYDYVSEGTPILNATHIKDGRIEPDSEVTADDETVERLRIHKLEADDLLFGRRGEAARVALVARENAGWLCGTGSIRVRIRDPRLLPGLVARFAGSSIVAEHFETIGGRLTMLNLNEEMLKALPIPFAPIGEQRQILRTLDGLVSATESATNRLNAQVTLLAEYRQAGITAAVTGQLDEETLMGRKPADEAMGVEVPS